MNHSWYESQKGIACFGCGFLQGKEKPNCSGERWPKLIQSFEDQIQIFTNGKQNMIELRDAARGKITAIERPKLVAVDGSAL